MTDRSAHMTKEVEMLALAEEYENDLRRITASGEWREGVPEKFGLVIAALRAAASPSPDAGLVEAVTKLPRRIEPISGQRFSYVKLDDVLALLSHRRDAGAGEVVPVGYAIPAYFNERRDEYELNGTIIYSAPSGMATMPLYATPAPQPGRDTATIERERCIAICESWIGTYQDKDIQYTSPQEYAVGAVNDIVDLIRDGTDLRTGAHLTEERDMPMTFEEWKLQYRHRVALVAGIKQECFSETLNMIADDECLREIYMTGQLPNEAADEEMSYWSE